MTDDLVEWCSQDLPCARYQALEAENERLSYNGIHTCSDECQRLPCVQRREIDRLKGALAKIADLGHWETMTEGCNAATDAVSIARAALGEKQ